MTADKLKQHIALFGGLLSAILLFLRSLDIDLKWFDQGVIDSFVSLLLALVPFVLVLYGVWKNSYIVTKKAREQEKVLKKNGLK
ncbi:phage holin [Solibacillus sp. FSL H8-0538]|uniref:phage holin n=1 Tax=Solibacillus sp. FSL H8-0538 TaxID=2921400 RepID=UPI0030FA786F